MRMVMLDGQAGPLASLSRTYAYPYPCTYICPHSQRLQRLEGGQAALTKLLQGAAESLAGVKASLAENVAAMADNVREVDARLAELN